MESNLNSDNYVKLFRLEGKTAVLTGAGGILGRRFAKGLAQFGANLALLDLHKEGIQELANELSETYKIKASAFVCDVADPDSVEKTIQEVGERFVSIDILHNNAASKSEDLNAFFASFEEYSLKEWRNIMSVNIDGYFLMAKAVGKHMLKQKKGSIIQTASIYGVLAPDQRIYEGSFYLGRPINTPAVYSVSKAAVIGLSQYLASYWAHAGIRVNTLTPGGNQSGQNEEFQKRYSARVPLGRMGNPDEMVGALIYLASDASSYVTGQNLIVDGGLTAW